MQGMMLDIIVRYMKNKYPQAKQIYIGKNPKGTFVQSDALDGHLR